jgi:hypothetical protein
MRRARCLRGAAWAPTPRFGRPGIAPPKATTETPSRSERRLDHEPLRYGRRQRTEKDGEEGAWRSSRRLWARSGLTAGECFAVRGAKAGLPRIDPASLPPYHRALVGVFPELRFEGMPEVCLLPTVSDAGFNAPVWPREPRSGAAGSRRARTRRVGSQAEKSGTSARPWRLPTASPSWRGGRPRNGAPPAERQVGELWTLRSRRGQEALGSEGLGGLPEARVAVGHVGAYKYQGSCRYAVVRYYVVGRGPAADHPL